MDCACRGHDCWCVRGPHICTTFSSHRQLCLPQHVAGASTMYQTCIIPDSPLACYPQNPTTSILIVTLLCRSSQLGLRNEWQHLLAFAASSTPVKTAPVTEASVANQCSNPTLHAGIHINWVTSSGSTRTGSPSNAGQMWSRQRSGGASCTKLQAAISDSSLTDTGMCGGMSIW